MSREKYRQDCTGSVAKGRKLWIVLTFALFGIVWFAPQKGEASDYCCCCESPSSRLYVGPEFHHTRLKIERGGSQNLLDERCRAKLKGVLRGVNGGYEYKPDCGFYFNLDGTWSIGSLDADNVHDRYLHEYIAEGRLGYTISWSSIGQGSFTPYIGFGYYLLHERIDSSHHDFLRYYNYYTPIGAIFDLSFGPCWRVRLDGKWMPQVDTTAKIGSLREIRWDLKKQVGWQIDVPISYLFCCGKGELAFVPFYRYHAQGEIKADEHCEEEEVRLPKQRLNSYGGRIILAWRF